MEESECSKSRNCEWEQYDETTLEKIDDELDDIERNEHSFLMDIAMSHSIESELMFDDVSMMGFVAILSALIVVMALYRCWNMREAKDGYIKLQN